MSNNTKKFAILKCFNTDENEECTCSFDSGITVNVLGFIPFSSINFFRKIYMIRFLKYMS